MIKEPRGPPTLSASPGFAWAAQRVAGPASCRAKSISRIFAAASWRRGVKSRLSVLGSTRGVERAVGKEQLDMIVEAEAAKALEVSGQRDADHVRGNPVDLLDRERTAARLMAHAARRTRIGGRRSSINRRGGGGHFRNAPNLIRTLSFGSSWRDGDRFARGCKISAPCKFARPRRAMSDRIGRPTCDGPQPAFKTAGAFAGVPAALH